MSVLLAPPVVDEAARRELRRQIARLEARCSKGPGPLERQARCSKGPGPLERRWAGGPRLLSLGELAAVRDALVAAEADERAAREARADAVARSRARLESALADPARHRWLRIPFAALDRPGCGAYVVRPRLGLVGMLAGWWEVKLSSGCP